jgi:hypothetical protein
LYSPAIALPQAASAMNSVMMGLFAKQASLPNGFPNSKSAALALAELTAESVMDVLPPSLDPVARLAMTLVSTDKAWLAKGTAFEGILDAGVIVLLVREPLATCWDPRVMGWTG